MTAELPEHLVLAVDQWFAKNTGLGGCSDQDVAQLGELFYGVTYQGGRESVEDALAVVDSFGPGVAGLNDTYARQVLLAAEIRRLQALYIKAVAGRSSMRDALMVARDHIEMHAFKASHCKDAAAIEGALADREAGPPVAITASIMQHEDPPAYCVMAAFRTEAEALRALRLATGQVIPSPGQGGST